MNDRISVIMPVKNAMPYLEECLDSILNQNYTHWELIAVNDHSTDESSRILVKYAEKDHRISVFQNKGNGIIDALQTAYKNAKGDYITRMDADDLMPVNKLETMLNELQKYDKWTLVTGYVSYFSDQGVKEGFKKYEQWLNSLIDKNLHHQEIYKECVIPSPCWLTTREAFEKAGGFNHNIYPEDYDLTFRFHLNNIKIKGIPELLHLWRDHSQRTSRTHVNYAVNSFLELKIHYFLQLNYQPNKKLTIWGAGRKGKKIAEILQKKEIHFDWICNNPNKIGVTYQGTIWQSCENYFNTQTAYQVIGIVARPSDQELINHQLTQQKNVEMFWFC